MAYSKAILLLGLLALVMFSEVFARELAEESVQTANVKEDGYGGYGGYGGGHGGYGGGHGGYGGGHGGYGGGHGGYGGGHGGYGGGYGGGHGGHGHGRRYPPKQGSGSETKADGN